MSKSIQKIKPTKRQVREIIEERFRLEHDNFNEKIILKEIQKIYIMGYNVVPEWDYKKSFTESLLKLKEELKKDDPNNDFYVKTFIEGHTRSWYDYWDTRDTPVRCVIAFSKDQQKEMISIAIQNNML